VTTSQFGRLNLAGRAIDYLSFYAAAAARLSGMARRGDIVVSKTDPPMLSVVIGPVARLRGAHRVNWLQDIFPEVAEALGVGGGATRAAFRLMRGVRNRSLRTADRNITLGERMTSKLQALGVAPDRIAAIPNWADGNLVRPVPHDRNDLRRAWGFEGKFVVGYSGNLGRAHEIGTLLGAIERTESQARSSCEDGPQVRWLFVGGGALSKTLSDEIGRRGLVSARFEPYQPRERLAESLSAADVHLVSLRPELEGLIVPSKIYGVAAAGRGAIFIGDSDGEVARLLARHDFGLTVPVNDAGALAGAIHTLTRDPKRCAALGRNARTAFDSAFDVSAAIGAWDALIADVLSQRSLAGRRLAPQTDVPAPAAASDARKAR
jgi:colanic acid biosynthesis glycosyl transferase WcaI